MGNTLEIEKQTLKANDVGQFAILTLCCLFVGLTGCYSFKAVNTTGRLAQEPLREMRALEAAYRVCLAVNRKENCEEKKKNYARIGKLLRLIAAYGKALTAYADAEVSAPKAEIAAIKSSLADWVDDDSQELAGAAIGLSGLLVRFVVDGYRREKLKEFIRRAKDNVDSIAGELVKAVRSHLLDIRTARTILGNTSDDLMVDRYCRSLVECDSKEAEKKPDQEKPADGNATGMRARGGRGTSEGRAAGASHRDCAFMSTKMCDLLREDKLLLDGWLVERAGALKDLLKALRAFHNSHRKLADDVDNVGNEDEKQLKQILVEVKKVYR
jgi:hypothetical protein